MASCIVLSHDEQLERLRTACPDAVPVAVVAGDVSYDRLLASRALRETYRQSFGLGAGQRLIVVSSTWGASSLFGEFPDLALRLATEMPVDEYRIAVALHPNIWFEHSPWQVNEWLASARRAGVIVLPVADGWKGALVACDLVLGDHGSVTYYAAALGRPLLLASAPVDAVAENSPIARLLTTAPRLRKSVPLGKQVVSTIERYDAADYAEITSLATSVPGRGAELFRTACYRLLRLPEPRSEPDSTAVPVLAGLDDRPDACVAEARWAKAGQPSPTVRIVRYSAERLRHGTSVARTAHLVVGTEEPRRRWLELADVLVAHRPVDDATRWIVETLSAMPGCLVAAAPEHSGAWFVGTTEVVLSLDAPASAGALCASALHSWLTRAGPDPVFPTRFDIVAGPSRYTVSVRSRVRPASAESDRCQSEILGQQR